MQQVFLSLAHELARFEAGDIENLLKIWLKGRPRLRTILNWLFYYISWNAKGWDFRSINRWRQTESSAQYEWCKYRSLQEGWRGLIGMKIGGVRELTIPANKAYGIRRAIKFLPNSPLKFISDGYWKASRYSNQRCQKWWLYYRSRVSMSKDVVIVGAGPNALTAAIYLSREDRHDAIGVAWSAEIAWYWSNWQLSWICWGRYGNEIGVWIATTGRRFGAKVSMATWQGEASWWRIGLTIDGQSVRARSRLFVPNHRKLNVQAKAKSVHCPWACDSAGLSW